MATVGEAIAASIIAQWNVGTGGTKPDPIKYVVEDSERNPNSKVADAVFVWLPLRRVFDNEIDVADKYRNVTYTVRIECHTKTDSARQLEIENEVDRILASGTPITGATTQKVLEINDVSDRSYSVGAKFVSEILMEVFTAMEVSATAYGGATTAALVTDTLEFTAGGGTIDRFYDEDDMASDDEDGLASQQSIKAYVDAANMIGPANAEFVNCIFEIGDTPAKVKQSSFRLTNIDNTNDFWMLRLPKEATLGGLKLYIGDLRIGVFAANGTNYIDSVVVRGMEFNNDTTLISEAANRTAQGLYTTANGPDDASTYEFIGVSVATVVANAGVLKVNSIALKCYYDT